MKKSTPYINIYRQCSGALEKKTEEQILQNQSEMKKKL
jgi:hypothetical protein